MYQAIPPFDVTVWLLLMQMFRWLSSVPSRITLHVQFYLFSKPSHFLCFTFSSTFISFPNYSAPSVSLSLQFLFLFQTISLLLFHVLFYFSFFSKLSPFLNFKFPSTSISFLNYFTSFSFLLMLIQLFTQLLLLLSLSQTISIPLSSSGTHIQIASPSLSLPSKLLPFLYSISTCCSLY